MTANVTHEPASDVAGGASPGVGYPKPEGKRIPVGDPRHFQMVEFLEEESALLDDDDLTGWLGMLAPDVIYRAPVRVTREHRSRGMFESEMFHFNENAMTLMLKIMRFTQTDSAWSENPASRTNRIVHKVRVYETDNPEEYEVRSSVLLLRSRNDDATLEMLPARRIDIVRAGDPLKIASRTLYFEQSTLGVQNLAVYL